MNEYSFSDGIAPSISGIENLLFHTEQNWQFLKLWWTSWWTNLLLRHRLYQLIANRSDGGRMLVGHSLSDPNLRFVVKRPDN